MKRVAPLPNTSVDLIPEFCRGRALLMVALFMQIIALVLTLSSSAKGVDAAIKIALLTLFLQWMGVCGAAVLCAARRWLRIARPGVVFFVCWGLLVMVTLLVSEVAWSLLSALQVAITMDEPRYEFLLRNSLVGAVVSLLLLRYFWQRHEWEAQMRAESEARYLALQARIRPHFLFNSLNSIAELIRSKPDEAERMVEDLSDLFRVSLDSRSRLVTLQEEIDVVKGYLRIEEVRLADKLLVNWAIPEELLGARIPRLIIQPLAENAVFHGVSRLRGRGLIHVTAHRDGDFIVIDVENPLPPEEAPKTRGTGVAVNNIAQRIKLIYGDRARIQLGEDRNEFGPLFRARLRLPLEFGLGEGT